MLENIPADTAEIATVSARTRRHQARHRTVDDLDLRSRAGRRAAELMHQFEAELGGDLTAGQKLAVSRAAVMTAIAEDSRIRKLNGASDVTLNNLVRLDRIAAAAVRALGLDKPSSQAAHAPLRERLAGGGAT